MPSLVFCDKFKSRTFIGEAQKGCTRGRSLGLTGYPERLMKWCVRNGQKGPKGKSSTKRNLRGVGGNGLKQARGTGSLCGACAELVRQLGPGSLSASDRMQSISVSSHLYLRSRGVLLLVLLVRLPAETPAKLYGLAGAGNRRGTVVTMLPHPRT